MEPGLGEPPAPLLYCTEQKTPDNGMTFGLFLLRDTGLAPGPPTVHSPTSTDSARAAVSTGGAGGSCPVTLRCPPPERPRRLLQFALPFACQAASCPAFPMRACAMASACHARHSRQPYRYPHTNDNASSMSGGYNPSSPVEGVCPGGGCLGPTGATSALSPRFPWTILGSARGSSAGTLRRHRLAPVEQGWASPRVLVPHVLPIHKRRSRTTRSVSVKMQLLFWRRSSVSTVGGPFGCRTHRCTSSHESAQKPLSMTVQLLRLSMRLLIWHQATANPPISRRTSGCAKQVLKKKDGYHHRTPTIITVVTARLRTASMYNHSCTPSVERARERPRARCARPAQGGHLGSARKLLRDMPATPRKQAETHLDSCWLE